MSLRSQQDLNRLHNSALQGIEGPEELAREVELIKLKKSKKSKRHRDYIVWYAHHLVERELKENEPERTGYLDVVEETDGFEIIR